MLVLRASWLRRNRVTPQVIAKARLARGEEPAKVLEGLAAGLVNKILHHPTQALNRAAEAERETLVRAVETLFPDNGGGREEPGEP